MIPFKEDVTYLFLIKYILLEIKEEFVFQNNASIDVKLNYRLDSITGNRRNLP